MGARKANPPGDETPPRYPDTVAPLTIDQSAWVMKSIGALDNEVKSLAKQIEGVDKKIDGLVADLKDVSAENKKHGRWIAIANSIAILIGAVIAFFANKVWDLIVSRLPPP